MHACLNRALPTLRRPNGHPDWNMSLSLPPGEHWLQFLVNGRWMTSPGLPVGPNDQGHVCNRLVVDAPPAYSLFYATGWQSAVLNYRIPGHVDTWRAVELHRSPSRSGEPRAGSTRGPRQPRQVVRHFSVRNSRFHLSETCSRLPTCPSFCRCSTGPPPPPATRLSRAPRSPRRRPVVRGAHPRPGHGRRGLGTAPRVLHHPGHVAPQRLWIERLVRIGCVSPRALHLTITMTYADDDARSHPCPFRSPDGL